MNPCRPLTPTEYQGLRDLIADEGIRQPVLINQHGQIIDGHHRRQIADELGIDCPTATMHTRDDDHLYNLRIRFNIHRRQLDHTDRQTLHLMLRAEGKSLRAIADETGYSEPTVRRDISGIASSDAMPDRIVTKDGRTYPATRPAHTIQPGDTITTDDNDDPHTITRIEHYDTNTLILHDDNDEAAIVHPNTPIHTRPSLIPTKPDLGDGISHPARYSPGILETFAELITRHTHHKPTIHILDPFAGTGRIHQLRDTSDNWHTTGVELEHEWANLHPHTITGNALDLPFAPDTFDVIATSPTYGNRLADHHNANDPDRRRSYTHDLGRPLTVNNSGTMQWGDEYRTFHIAAWKESRRVLREHGQFLLNIKDHIRTGAWQDVAGWHVQTLNQLGFQTDAIRPVSTLSLRTGANNDARSPVELVVAFTLVP